MDWKASFSDRLSEISRSAGEHLPAIVGAAALLLLGWGVALLFRFLAVRLVSRVPKLVPFPGVRRELQDAGMETLAPKVIGAVVFWLVLLLFLAAGGEVLGLGVITTGLGRLAEYIPSLLGAVLVIFVGVIVGNLARAGVVRVMGAAGVAQTQMLGHGARLVVLLLAGVIALDQAGIDSTILILFVNILLGAMIGGAALAFGLGAREVVGDLLALHYLGQTYRVGQKVRIGDLKGRIAEFTNTGVIIETVEGRVLVPGRDFAGTRSVHLNEGDPGP